MEARQSHPGSEPTTGGPGPTREVIARLAELIWEKEGRPEGRDVEFWLRAEAELRGSNERIPHHIPS